MRVVGITWGVPTPDRLFSYHPDESVVVSYSLRLNPFLGQLDPQFYNYGSLSLLLNSIVIHAGEAVGMVGGSPAPGVPSAGALLAARTLTAMFGAGTCVLLALTGARLWSVAAGAAAGFLYALAPLAVQHGHFATVDVPATFWVAGALFFAARYVSQRGSRDLLWCGVWSGLAAATKYNAGLVVLAGAAAHMLSAPRQPRPLGVLILGAVAGFVVGCPGVLLNPGDLIGGILYEAAHVRSQHGLVFVGTPPGLIYHLTFNLRWALGLPLLVLALSGVVAAVVRRSRGDLILLAFLVPYYLLIGLANVKFARYNLPLLPPLLLLTGALWAHPFPQRPRMALAGLGAIAAVYALLLSLAFNQAMTATDPRDLAAQFIKTLKPNTVGFATGPWFWSPPLHPGLAAFNPAQAKQFAADATNPHLYPAEGEWNADQLRATDPDVVPLSEFEFTDPLRIGHQPMREYVTFLDARLPKREILAQPLKVFGLHFTNVDSGSDLPSQGLPHDMLYTNPTVVVRYR